MQRSFFCMLSLLFLSCTHGAERPLKNVQALSSGRTDESVTKETKDIHDITKRCARFMHVLAQQSPQVTRFGSCTRSIQVPSYTMGEIIRILHDNAFGFGCFYNNKNSDSTSNLEFVTYQEERMKELGDDLQLRYAKIIHSIAQGWKKVEKTNYPRIAREPQDSHNCTLLIKHGGIKEEPRLIRNISCLLPKGVPYQICDNTWLTADDLVPEKLKENQFVYHESTKTLYWWVENDKFEKVITAFNLPNFDE